ncbi:MAG: hypothetical protein QOJ19_4229 [Acidimicrobiia bacterium]|nr:hypothetical protein [Acidimicrobiia bacterium]
MPATTGRYGRSGPWRPWGGIPADRVPLAAGVLRPLSMQAPNGPATAAAVVDAASSFAPNCRPAAAALQHEHHPRSGTGAGWAAGR